MKYIGIIVATADGHKYLYKKAVAFIKLLLSSALYLYASLNCTYTYIWYIVYT